MDNEAAALARKRWAKAKRLDKQCSFCGSTYRGVVEQLYCTPKHQNAAAARRLRDKRRAGSPPAPAAVQPAPSKPDVNLGLARALYEVEVCRAAGDDAGVSRWEQIAAGIAQSAESVD